MWFKHVGNTGILVFFSLEVLLQLREWGNAQRIVEGLGMTCLLQNRAKHAGNTGIFVFFSLGVLLHLGKGLCEDSSSVERLGMTGLLQIRDKYAGNTGIFVFFFFFHSRDITSLGRLGRGT